jgi:lipopolysaccharide transport system permease protein
VAAGKDDDRVSDSPDEARTVSLADPRAVPLSLWRHREIVWQLARREVVARYRGSMLGMFWAFGVPLLMLAIYTLVFGAVFHVRWPIPAENGPSFALILFSGLVVYTLFSECVIRAPTLVLAHATYVKKIVFPLEVLPWVVMATGLFHAGVSLIVLVVARTLLQGPPPWTVVLLPFILTPCILFTMGLSWLLASLGVFFRDIAQTVGLFTMAVLFLSPVFYPVSALPPGLRTWVWLNPLTVPIEHVRAALFLGETPAWGTFFMALAIGYGVAWAGLAWFQKTRPSFADVL